MTGVCSITRDSVRCLAAAEWSVTFGCLHEHIGTELACGPCLALVDAALGQRELVCMHCRDHLAAPHICLVLSPPLARARVG